VKDSRVIDNNSASTLQFWLTEIPKGLEQSQALEITVSNFNTPWSSQNLKFIQLRYFRDQQCTIAPLKQVLTSITILPETIKAKDNATISSISGQNYKTVGYRGSDNTLEISFTPVTMMPKRGYGKLELHLPPWYSLNMESEYMI